MDQMLWEIENGRVIAEGINSNTNSNDENDILGDSIIAEILDNTVI